LSVEANEDTGDEAGCGDAGAAPNAGGAAKVRRRTTRSAVGKHSPFAAAAAVKATKKKKRKRRAASPPTERGHPVRVSISFEKNFYRIPFTPPPLWSPYRSFKEEEEEEKEKDETIIELSVQERPARRSESPTAKRQRELV
jgi:hypothetical protein